MAYKDLHDVTTAYLSHIISYYSPQSSLLFSHIATWNTPSSSLPYSPDTYYSLWLEFSFLAS